MITLQPFEPFTIILVGALNPVAIAVAYFMGRDADQWQKLIVAAFASACAGFLALFAVAYFRIIIVQGFGAPTGVFVVQFLLGLVWAYIGYRMRAPKSPSV
ncbi:MAG: hypothetical protein RIC14_03285 [Filomicrobium sp.]